MSRFNTKPVVKLDWVKIIDLFEAVSELDIDEAIAKLSALKVDDTTTREVLKLVVSHKAVKTKFLEPRVVSVIDSIAENPERFFAANASLSQSFEFVHILGTSPHSVVVAAKDLLLGRQIVIKITDSGLTEATIMAKFRAAQIVEILSIIDFGNADIHGLIMPYQSETTLADIIKNAPSDAMTFVKILEDLASALLVAHQAGILHLDVKPTNVLVEPSSRAYLMDFNVSMKLQEIRQNQASIKGGTTRYMAPEQELAFKGKGTDLIGAATDIYAYGKVIEDILPALPEKTLLHSRLQVLQRHCCQEDISARPPSFAKILEYLDGIKMQLVCDQKLQELHNKQLGLFITRPRLMIYATIILTNLAASILQILYNQTYVIDLLTPDQQDLFNKIVLPWNIFAFVAAFFCIYMPFRDVFTFIEQKGRAPYHVGFAAGSSRDLRQKLLRFSKVVARVVAAFWVAGFFVFALPLHILRSFPANLAIHFFISFIVAMSLAVFYSLIPLRLPFLGIGYNWLLQEENTPQQVVDNEMYSFPINRRFVPFVAGAIPLTVTVLMIWFFHLEPQRVIEYRVLLSLFIAVGIAGFSVTLKDSFRLDAWHNTLTSFKSRKD